MKKKLLIILCITFILSVNMINAEEIKKEQKKQDGKYISYFFKTTESGRDKAKPNNYNIEYIKKMFIENNKNIKIQEIDNEIKIYEAKNSKKASNDLMNKIDDLGLSIDESYNKIDQIDSAITLSNSLNEGNPNKLKEAKIQEFIKNKEQLYNAIDAYQDNIDSMNKNYVMLDFKQEAEKLNTEYNKESLDSFNKIQVLNFNNKILDILNLEVNKRLKQNELEFMLYTFNLQKKSFELGYIDASAIKDFESKIKILKNDLNLKDESINYKLKDLEILSGLKNIDGFIIDKNYFNTSIKSKEVNYYKDKYTQNSYELTLLDKQIKEMEKTVKRLKNQTEGFLDSKIVDFKMKKTKIQRNLILENIELGAINLISKHDSIEKERNKTIIKIKESKRKLDLFKKKLDLGYMSKIDYKKNELEYLQLDKAKELITINQLRLKFLLEAMEEGIVKK